VKETIAHGWLFVLVLNKMVPCADNILIDCLLKTQQCGEEILMMKRLIIVIFLATIFTGLCAAQSQLRNFHQEGPASQEILTQELTASHPSLPLGTQVRVTNPRNGKQTTVRITGRIPATEGRIVDLSTGAAAALELPTQGRNPVVLEIVPATRQRAAVTPTEELPPPIVEPVDELPPEEPPPPEEPKEAPTEEQPQLPPHEDPSKTAEPAVEYQYQYPPTPETEYIPGADPQAPAVNTTDTKNQTTAPVSAQSPNITIYNVLQSPNSFATDSAPVNAEGGAGGQAPITAAAPTATVSRSDQTTTRTNNPSTTTTSTNNPSTTTTSTNNPSTTTTTLPPTSQENNKPATATATAQIVVPQQPSQAGQGTVQSGQPTQPTQPATRPVQPSPQPPEPSPLPPIVDRGTALIKPFMPNADNGKVYRVQVGSYQNTWHAREAYDRLTTVGFKPAYESYSDYIRVVIPGIPARDMPAVARLLGRVGFTEALIREEN
jgi:rare lipoprotein A